MQIDGKHKMATHVALHLAGRPVPQGFMACHHCDNPPCVNPAHLFVGTAQENAVDAIVKGRFVFPPHVNGERINTARLSEDQVRRIRAEYRPGVRVSAVANKNGISWSAASAIIKGKSWKHLLDEVAA